MLDNRNHVPLGPSARQGNTSFAVSVGLLLLRLAIGWVFIYAGAGKLFGAFGGMGMTIWTGAMEQMKMPVLPPAAWAYISAGGEFFGGLFILIGLLSRLAALPLIATMFVAIVQVTGANGFGGSQDKDGGVHMGYEFNLVLVVIAAVILIAGPGIVSLDALIFKRGFWARGPQPLDQPVKPS